MVTARKEADRTWVGLPCGIEDESHKHWAFSLAAKIPPCHGGRRGFESRSARAIYSHDRTGLRFPASEMKETKAGSSLRSITELDAADF